MQPLTTAASWNTDTDGFLEHSSSKSVLQGARSPEDNYSFLGVLLIQFCKCPLRFYWSMMLLNSTSLLVFCLDVLSIQFATLIVDSSTSSFYSLIFVSRILWLCCLVPQLEPGEDGAQLPCSFLQMGIRVTQQFFPYSSCSLKILYLTRLPFH